MNHDKKKQYSHNIEIVTNVSILSSTKVLKKAKFFIFSAIPQKLFII